MKTFTVYRSSAGSGKTRTLAKEYLKLALINGKDYMKHILAVTFTNKATQEMKERIVLFLDEFASGKENNLTAELCKELSMDKEALQRRSQEVLSVILHQYSQFAISTIDAFFQRVIRSFTREAGLLGNFRLESDNDVVMDEVIKNLMDEVGTEAPDLTDWLIQFSRENLQDGETWNITGKLKQFAGEIHKEHFKEIEDDVLEVTTERHKEIRSVLHAEMKSFMADMKKMGAAAVAIMDKHGITKEDFSYGAAGTAWKYFTEFSEGRHTDTGDRIKASALSPDGWAPKKSPRYAFMRKVADAELMDILKKMVDHHHKKYNTAEAILENYYSYGLIADLTRKLKTYKEENNVMLLSDSSKFLNGIINDSDTPFIYEKVGTYFHHYLIDEFQDTSRLQWKNFIPLLKEASDQGNANMIVGDVKQSIYRWRGGDLELLQNEVNQVFGQAGIEWQSLHLNFRSGRKIIEFNNLFFKSAASLASIQVSNTLPMDVYHDVKQEVVKKGLEGYVEINFIGDRESGREESLQRLPGLFEKLQDLGVPLSDIAILVRENKDGQEVVQHMLRFQNSPEAKKQYRYDVVSNESLRLDTAFSVGVIVSAMKLLNNSKDAVARGQLAYEASSRLNLDTLFVRARQEQLEDILPEAFVRHQAQLRRLSLFELTEELIRIFNLGVYSSELAYIQAFQDTILEFSAREKTDIGTFLEWWEIYRTKKSIKASRNVPAANILTIHSAKGLEFKYVVVPFCDWYFGSEGKSSTLWVSTDEPPFQPVGKVPVNLSSDLDKTYFQDDYQKEKTKIHLDNLNLLYVAFTRAEDGLFVFAKRPKEKRDKISFVNDLMLDVLSGENQFSNDWDGSRLVYGTLEKPAVQAEKSIMTVKLDRYASCDWRKKLVIKREGAEFFNDTISEKRSKINHGIVVHQVLSRISHKEDMESALDAFFLEKAMLPEEKDAVKKAVTEIMNHPVASQWFTKDWEVMNEQLILMPGGEQKRIDRVMVSKKNTIIIDYKTGKKKEEDRTQVANYALILSQMGYPNVLAYLLYLDDMRVEPVMRNANLSLF